MSTPDGPLPTSDGGDSGSSHLVVIGSSAGGIEALGKLLGGLSPGFPAPVVLAQHLDPGRRSHLQEILQRKTELPIVLVTETTRLRPGSVYVVPANRHVVVNDGSVDIAGDHGERPRPSVDLLLSTAARAYGDRLVAVILTGAGSDGAAGAVEVKQAGGTVVIQNPSTARYPSMPLALPPTVIDHVIDVERIPALLGEILEHPGQPRARTSIEEPLARIVDLVSGQSSVTSIPTRGPRSSGASAAACRRHARTRSTSTRNTSRRTPRRSATSPRPSSSTSPSSSGTRTPSSSFATPCCPS